MPGASSTTTSSSSASQPQAPAWLTRLAGSSGSAWQKLLNAAQGGFMGQLQPNPLQTAQLSADEQKIISEIAGGTYSTPDLSAARGIYDRLPFSTSGNLESAENAIGNIGGPQSKADLASARSLLGELTGGPIGSSPATTAAMRAYQTSAVPQILSGEALSGSGRGGGITQALTQGEEQAYVPLVQQEIANREAGISQYQGLATTESELAQMRANGYENLAQFRQNQALAQAGGYQSLASLGSSLGIANLGAADMPRQIQQQQFQAAFEDLLRRFQLEQEAVLGPVQEFGPALISSQGRETGTSTPGWLQQLEQLGLFGTEIVGQPNIPGFH